MPPFSLQGLDDPSLRPSLIDLNGIEPHSLKKFLAKMFLIRESEKVLAQARKESVVRGPVHLSVGQEAGAVALSHHLNSGDLVFGAHRSHAHYLALDTDLTSFFAEILCRSTGVCGGRGGSMHLSNFKMGFAGSVPIVAGTVPLAVGAGMSFKIQSKPNIAVAYFGDGACEEGIVHESLNLASTSQSPVLFVVENNLFSSHMHIDPRQPHRSVTRFADAHGVKSMLIDGNDIAAISKKTGALIAEMRANPKPVFVELVTFRWYGHVDWREDIDVGVNRAQSDITEWKRTDPILRLTESMKNSKLIDNEEIDEIFSNTNRKSI